MVNYKQEVLPAKPRFRLSIWSWALCGMLSVAWIALQAIVLGGAATPERAGYLTGQLVGMGILAVGIAWIIFLVSGRSKRAPSIAVVAVFGLALLGQVAGSIKDAQSESAKLDSDTKEFIGLAKSVDQAENIGEREEIVLEGLGKLAPGLALTIEEIRKSDAVALEEFSKAQGMVMGDRFLSFQLMLKKEEYRWQHEVAKRFQVAGVNSLATAEASQKKLYTRLETDDDIPPALAKGMRRGYDDKALPALAYYKGNIAIANSYAQLITALEEQHGRWKLDEDSAATFDSSEAQTRFDSILTDLSAHEDEVNILAETINQ